MMCVDQKQIFNTQLKQILVFDLINKLKSIFNYMPKNPWIEFQQKHKGKGLSSSEMSAMYKKSKQAPSVATQTPKKSKKSAATQTTPKKKPTLAQQLAECAKVNARASRIDKMIMKNLSL
jgi:DNA-directed RNA polymerase specialized sigma54-like protein